MSEVIKKVMMCAVLMSTGAGQLFSSEVDHSEHKKKKGWSLSCFHDAVKDIKEAAPVMEKAGTAAISAATVIAAANGDEKAVENLDKAQTILNGTVATITANNPHAALDSAESTVLTIAPHTAGDIAKLNNVVAQGEEIAKVAQPLIEIAVANVGQK